MLSSRNSLLLNFSIVSEIKDPTISFGDGFSLELGLLNLGRGWSILSVLPYESFS